MAIYCGQKNHWLHPCKLKECNLEKCNNYIECYSGTDYVKQFWTLYSRYDKCSSNTSSISIDDARILAGHYSICNNDIDSILWKALTVKIFRERKYSSYRESRYFIEAIAYMKGLNIKLPKHINRKYKRLKQRGLIDIDDFKYYLERSKP